MFVDTKVLCGGEIVDELYSLISMKIYVVLLDESHELTMWDINTTEKNTTALIVNLKKM